MSFLAGRARALLRSRRLRAIALLVGSYKTYTSFQNYTILNKTFSSARHRPGQTVLDLDLDAVSISSHDPQPSLSAHESLRLHTLIDVLRAAQADPRVTALVVRGLSGISNMGLADVAELRAAIENFSTAWGGKHAMLHVSEGIGSFGNGTLPLYFASAFDSIHVHPTSVNVIPGLSLGSLFFKRLFDTLGLKTTKVARKEFKTAANTFTEDSFTAPHRESTRVLLTAIMDHVVESVARGRRLSQAAVRNAIDVAFLSPDEAQQKGLLDLPLYRDQLPAQLRQYVYDGIEKRAEMRKKAEVEWRAAMKQLSDVWTAKDGWLNLWDHGDIIRNVDNFHVAVPGALAFGNQSNHTVAVSVDAEIRAFKAHLAWLDTCPWEAFSDEHVAASTVYRAIPNISLIMNAERKLCENAIRALEELPKLLALHKDKEKDVIELDKHNFLPIVRWCRAMWKAKCMAARMVGTIGDTKHNVKLYLSPEQAIEREAEIESLTYDPRLFLVGYADEYLPGEKEEPVATEEQQEEKKPEEAKLITLEFGEEAEEKKILEPHEKIPLRYVRFSDYVDLVQSEKRASLERGKRFGSFSPPGTIDRQEKVTMLNLQLPGHRFTPWRLNQLKGNIVAVVHIDGVISDDTADTIRAAIRRADNDPTVKAIVLRVDSPGGSSAASDLICRAVDVAKKPVVASMGSMCASGGYYVSALCDKVFASNMTITGSIGVIFQSFNLSGLFEKLGITSDSCESGRFAKYFGHSGMITEWTEDFAGHINTIIDRGYNDFVSVVAKGRSMEFNQAERIARGRVWAGSDALKLGLVDQIGGLHDAVEAAAELAFLPPDVEVKAVDYPTMAMLVQDAARRRGFMSSNLNEEGDEAVPEKKPKRFWSVEEPQPPQHPGQGREPVKSGIPSTLALSDEDWSISHFFVFKVLTALDRYLLTSNSPSFMTGALESLLGSAFVLLEGNRSTDIASQELKKAKATSGRLAAIAPSLHAENP